MTMTSRWNISPETGGEVGRIVVGYDGSAASSNAVDWAALEASARGWPLWMIASSHASHGCPHAVHKIADRLGDNLGISVVTTDRAPYEPLTAGVTEHDLLVLGPTSAHSPSPSLQRSVAPTASRRSPCPVVMVRGSFTRRIQRIVLGVDGSSAAQSAIEWACAEAMIHDAELLVAHVSEPDAHVGDGDRVVDDALDECWRRIGSRATELSAQGSPSSLLLALTRHRDLVVVGSRGRSGFRTTLFGSVPTSLADHSFCPVVITQPHAKRDREETCNAGDRV